jgi:hypothetical protein
MNLDKLTDHELVVIYQRFHRHPRLMARSLWPGRPGAVKAAKNMGAYAINRATALRHPDEADTYLAICEKIYNDLPEYARWRGKE